MYDILSKLVKLTSSIGINLTIYSFIYRNGKILKQYNKI